MTQEQQALFVQWDELDPKVKTIAIDFVYQGYGTGKGKRPLIKCMDKKDDPKSYVADYIQGNVELQKYEEGRKREAYLRAK